MHSIFDDRGELIHPRAKHREAVPRPLSKELVLWIAVPRGNACDLEPDSFECRARAPGMDWRRNDGNPLNASRPQQFPRFDRFVMSRTRRTRREPFDVEASKTDDAALVDRTGERAGRVPLDCRRSNEYRRVPGSNKLGGEQQMIKRLAADGCVRIETGTKRHDSIDARCRHGVIAHPLGRDRLRYRRDANDEGSGSRGGEKRG